MVDFNSHGQPQIVARCRIAEGGLGYLFGTAKPPVADDGSGSSPGVDRISGFIDAGTASSSPFQRTAKNVPDDAGIVFTFV
jgi:hypothetical protein